MLLKNGYSKADFAKKIDLSKAMTIQITNGDRCPSPKIAKRIAEVLNVEWDDIFVIEKPNNTAS
ncbi:helix-turn-helix transcriptional regulator [Paenibacillus sp. J31TS4]|uniref:helix-turn-helix transcriptional regulator n=1 Tax=Paenibacillus sp. J31TS4 TaxID=2807195 RepID=UPI0035B53DBD